MGYQSDFLAGFHVPETTLPVPIRCERADEISELYQQQRKYNLDAAVLVSNPVSQGIDAEVLQTWLAEAHQDAARAGVQGKDSTPFLLARLAELSQGRTVEVNLRLLRENAQLAAKIALALSHAPSMIGYPA